MKFFYDVGRNWSSCLWKPSSRHTVYIRYWQDWLKPTIILSCVNAVFYYYECMLLQYFFKYLQYFNESIFIEPKNIVFQNKLNIVQTLLKWLFWTSINLVKHYISWSICMNNCVWDKGILPPHTCIRFLNKINNLNDLFHT